jgi:hypothetical protein
MQIINIQGTMKEFFKIVLTLPLTSPSASLYPTALGLIYLFLITTEAAESR